MSIDNFNNVHLTEEQTNAVNEALTSLETALNLLKVVRLEDNYTQVFKLYGNIFGHY